MNRRPFPQGIGCMAFGAMAGGAMAAEAVKHEPRRPNLPYVFAVELRAQGLMEPYKAVDVEALCAKRPNVHQRGHAGALTAANRFCTAMPPSPASRTVRPSARWTETLGARAHKRSLAKKSALHAQDRWPRPRPPPTEAEKENAPQSVKSSCIQSFCPCTKPLPSRFSRVILDVVCHCRQHRTVASFAKESAGRRIACGKGAKRNSHSNMRESP